MGDVHVVYKTTIVKTTIELNELETCWLKQILERAEALSMQLGPEVQGFRRWVMEQLPQEA